SLPGSPGRGSRTVLDLRGVSFVEAVDHRAGVVVTGALGEIGLPGKFLGQFARRDPAPRGERAQRQAFRRLRYRTRLFCSHVLTSRVRAPCSPSVRTE